MTEVVGFETMVILDPYGMMYGLRTPNEGIHKSKISENLADALNSCT